MQNGRFHPEMSGKEQSIGPDEHFNMDDDSYTG